jgi:hypothetical protein
MSSLFLLIIGYAVAVLFPVPYLSAFVISLWAKFLNLSSTPASTATPASTTTNTVVAKPYTANSTTF